jgi:hypothetical protein
MSELKSRLRADLTAAMKSQDKLRTATLRMLLAAVRSEEVSGKQARELSDEDVLKVLAREAKKRGEAAEIYTQNGRAELAPPSMPRLASSTSICRHRCPMPNSSMWLTPRWRRSPRNSASGPASGRWVRS